MHKKNLLVAFALGAIFSGNNLTAADESDTRQVLLHLLHNDKGVRDTIHKRVDIGLTIAEERGRIVSRDFVNGAIDTSFSSHVTFHHPTSTAVASSDADTKREVNDSHERRAQLVAELDADAKRTAGDAGDQQLLAQFDAGAGNGNHLAGLTTRVRSLEDSMALIKALGLEKTRKLKDKSLGATLDKLFDAQGKFEIRKLQESMSILATALGMANGATRSPILDTLSQSVNHAEGNAAAALDAASRAELLVSQVRIHPAPAVVQPASVDFLSFSDQSESNSAQHVSIADRAKKFGGQAKPVSRPSSPRRPSLHVELPAPSMVSLVATPIQLPAETSLRSALDAEKASVSMPAHAEGVPAVSAVSADANSVVVATSETTPVAAIPNAPNID